MEMVEEIICHGIVIESVKVRVIRRSIYIKMLLHWISALNRKDSDMGSLLLLCRCQIGLRTSIARPF